jgi:DtxR family Mn-dependent transcriptional regulator
METLDAGDTGRFVRISDSDPAMLRYLGARGIAPGDRFEVLEKQPFGGPLFARFGTAADVHPLGGRLAAAMRVEVGR